MKYEDLKCEFCDGQGEKEKNIDGMDCPVTCTFCNGTGIDHNQLKKVSPIPELTEALEKIADMHPCSNPISVINLAKNTLTYSKSL